MRWLNSPVYGGEYGWREGAGIVARLLARGVLPGGARRLFHFVRSLPLLHPHKLPQALVDWIAALAMADNARRQLFDAPAAEADCTASRSTGTASPSWHAPG